jgi:hypothetical protein
MKIHPEPWSWMDYLDKQPEQWSMDIRVGTWNKKFV